MQNNNEEKYIVVGPSFISMLTIVFIVLKLVGVITWSWIWVMAPLWIPIAIVTAIFLCVWIVSFFVQN